MTALLARRTENLAGGPQAGRSDSPHKQGVKGVGSQQQHDDDDAYIGTGVIYDGIKHLIYSNTDCDCEKSDCRELNLDLNHSWCIAEILGNFLRFMVGFSQFSFSVTSLFL